MSIIGHWHIRKDPGSSAISKAGMAGIELRSKRESAVLVFNQQSGLQSMRRPGIAQEQCSNGCIGATVAFAGEEFEQFQFPRLMSSQIYCAGLPLGT